jgi:hypothetical protein
VSDAFVLDASVSLRWFLDHTVPPYANRIKQSMISGSLAVVPALWHLEMANGLVVAQRRGVLSASDVDRSLLDLEQLLAQMIQSDVALPFGNPCSPPENSTFLPTMPLTSKLPSVVICP